MSPETVVIRLPRTAYLVVLILAIGAIPVAFGDNTSHSLADSSVETGFAGFHVGWQTLVLLIPVIAAIVIARAATIVTPAGLRARAAFGSRDLPWDAIRGLSISGRAVYAVLADGSVRLPCVRIAHLGPISQLSHGRLPEIPEVVAKPAPAARRRRR